MKHTITLLLLFYVMAASAQSQSDLNNEACNRLKEADKELNTLYQQVLKGYAEDEVFISKFKNAQRAWIKFRDAHMASVFPYADEQGYYGSVYPMCRCEYLTQLTKQRNDQLALWVKGTEEGDVCAGSVRFKN